MGTERFYKPGSFYRVDDRTGFPIRAERTQKEWTGRIVRRESWEARHPQDFVTGVKDDQTVPEPRPRPTDLFNGPLTTTLAAQVAAGANLLTVAANTRMTIGDTVTVMLDTGIPFYTTIQGMSGTSIVQISAVLPYAASSGNIVTDISAVAQPTTANP